MEETNAALTKALLQSYPEVAKMEGVEKSNGTVTNVPSLRTVCYACRDVVSNAASEGHASIVNVGRLQFSETVKAAQGKVPDGLITKYLEQLSKCFQFNYDMCWRDDGGAFRFLTPCPVGLICAQCLGLPNYVCGDF